MPSLLFQEGPNKTGTSYALDCGAGIGRITKRLLLPLFGAVDMVDVTEDFLLKAKSYLGEEGKRVRNFFCCGLQDFSPEPHSYDVIWIQWVIGERPAPLLRLPAHLPPQRPGFPRPWELRPRRCCRGGRRGSLESSLHSPGLHREGSFASMFCFSSIPAVTHLGTDFLVEKF